MNFKKYNFCLSYVILVTLKVVVLLILFSPHTNNLFHVNVNAEDLKSIYLY